MTRRKPTLAESRAALELHRPAVQRSLPLRDARRDLRATLSIVLAVYEHVRLDDQEQREWLVDRLAAELCDDFEVRLKSGDCLNSRSGSEDHDD